MQSCFFICHFWFSFVIFYRFIVAGRSVGRSVGEVKRGSKMVCQFAAITAIPLLAILIMVKRLFFLQHCSLFLSDFAPLQQEEKRNGGGRSIDAREGKRTPTAAVRYGGRKWTDVGRRKAARRQARISSELRDRYGVEQHVSSPSFRNMARQFPQGSRRKVRSNHKRKMETKRRHLPDRKK